MREYIFYVLLVFVPICMLMIKILHNYGLSKKNIAYMVIISLVIILTFPISTEKLGLFLALPLYIAVFFLIVLSMVKVSGATSSETNSLASPHELSVSKNHKIDSNKQELKTESLIDKDKGKEEEVKEDIKAAENLDLSRKTTIEETIAQEDKPKINGTTTTKELSESKVTAIFADEPPLENPLELSEGQVRESLAEEEPDPYKGNDEINKLVELNGKLEGAAIKEAEEDKVAEEAIKEKDGPIKEDEKEKDAELDLNTFIESAFENKIAGDIEVATNQFQYIWENSKEDDLRYLITLELVELHKLLGQYGEAQVLLTNFLQEVPKDTKEGLEINWQLNYITLIRDEISRLGLKEVPLPKLPRWIKVKITDQLNLLDK